MWDVEQADRLWFSTEPDAPMYVTRAVVSGPSVGPVGEMRAMPLPRAAVRPGRLVLWRAAAALLATRPLLGIGPDNYRLLYGPHAGLGNSDSRVHTNNMYLEVLVGAGIVGALAFAWLFGAAFVQVIASVRSARNARMETAVAGVAAASVAIALHGLVDSFLSFTATYILIAVTLGMASASLAIQEQPQNTQSSQNLNPSDGSAGSAVCGLSHAHRI
jgi:O-antigen ligase